MPMNTFQQDIVSREMELTEQIVNLRNRVGLFRTIEANANWATVTNEDFTAIPAFDHLTKSDQNQVEQAMGRIVAAIDLELTVLARMLRP